MKRNILIIIALIVVGLLAYNFLNTGKITLIPSSGLSEEEQEIKMLEEELQAAERTFSQAGRAASLTGVDSTSDAAAAMRVVERVASRARELKRRATSEDIKDKIEQLEDKIKELKNKMEMP